jgi:UDP-2,4-diacetamido-2,4,6-trideoxy-beta-L-altropyranose hydrolase
MRCLGLAQAWQEEGGRVTFLTRSPPTRVADRILEESIELKVLDRTASAHEDIAAASRLGCGSWVVVDGYSFDESYLGALRRSGCRVMAIDDTVRLAHYAADVVLNQNPGFTTDSYQCPANGRVFLGPHYALVRREFLRLGQASRKSEAVQNILVTMGGSDPQNLTATAVEALKLLDASGIRIRVILGPANPWRPDIESQIGDLPNAEVLVSPANLPECMAEADLAVAASGSTCWELAYLGVPSLVAIAADNQLPIARSLHASGVVESLGWGSDITAASLADRLMGLIEDPVRRSQMSAAGRRLVDGRGAERIVKYLREQKRCECSSLETTDSVSVF